MRSTTGNLPGWSYGYDAKGQVTSAQRGTGSNLSPVSGQDWSYDYDEIGNRKSASHGGHNTTYQTNSLNQYTQITRPNALEVTGVTNATGVPRVSVNGQPASGRPATNGEPGGYAQWLENIANPADNNVGQWPEVTVTATSPGAAVNQSHITFSQTGRSLVHPSAEPTYDLDGNLTSDGVFNYTWDAERRLIVAEMPDVHVPLAVPLLRLEMSYDAQGRRIAKRVLEKATSSGLRATTWSPKYSLRFWYDGWNLVAETDTSGTLLRRYTWGTDLSGTAQGAGGVGGLLGVQALAKLYHTCTEANGNIVGLVDAVIGATVVRFDYDAFGNEITTWSAPQLDINAICPVRFSTKYRDIETELLYYGYRYYSPEKGRWLALDPIAERGGLNLKGMLKNDIINHHDYLGLLVQTSPIPTDSLTSTALRDPAGLAALAVATILLEEGLGPVTVRLPEEGRTSISDAVSNVSGEYSGAAQAIALGRNSGFKCPCGNKSKSFAWGDGRSAVGFGTFDNVQKGHKSPPDPVGKEYALAYSRYKGPGQRVHNGHTAPHRLWGTATRDNSVLEEAGINTGAVRITEGKVANLIDRPGAQQVCYLAIPIYAKNGFAFIADQKGSPYEGQWRPAPLQVLYFARVDYWDGTSSTHLFSTPRLPKLLGYENRIFSRDQIFDLN